MEQQLDAMAEKIMKRPEEEKEAQMSEWLLSRIEIEDADFEAKTLQIRCLEASLEVYAQCNSGKCGLVPGFPCADIPGC